MHRQAAGVALVTGASSGIGAATALALARRGYALALAARRAPELEQVAGQITTGGGVALAVPADLRDDAQVERLVGLSLEHFGRIDVLVNNAGVSTRHRAYAPSDEQIELVLGTNLIAPLKLTRAVLPAMLERRSGHIINIGSVAGHVSATGHALYNASKHALRSWNDTLRREVRRQGIRVSLISPGFIRTPMTTELRFVPKARPELVARAVVKLLRRPRRELVVPGYYRPLIWLTRSWPTLADFLLR